MSSLNPGLILILSALVLPLLPQSARRWLCVSAPLVGLAYVYTLDPGTTVTLHALGLPLEILRVDKLALVWGYIFNIAAFVALVFAWQVRDLVQQIAALIYAGAAISAVFAGDLITLFVYWELTAISSVFLIWATRTERAFRTGMRYLLIQVSSGVILLSGVLIWVGDTGSVAFEFIGLDSLAGKLIFLAFGIKCAFPLLHNWLQDAYPEATATGAVILSAFTTKLAVYALARGFPGTEMLIYVGATMAVFPMFFALIENDLRKVLAYSLNNQLGYMVVGVGIGTELALNGTAAHAVNHIAYKALLFMAMGAVLFRTGTCKASELGGLYKSMPYTTMFCIVGAASISAFPLFSGFVSKSLILSAVAEQHLIGVWIALLFASAGAFLYSAVKVPYFAFFAKDSGRRVKEAPPSMLLGMALTSFLCVIIGVYPDVLYGFLPFPVDYQPYTTSHVVQQLQLLLFAALVFVVLMHYRVYPPMVKSIHLDTDWVYRRLLPSFLQEVGRRIGKLDRDLREEALTIFREVVGILERGHGPNSALSRTIHAGTMAFIVVSVLLLFLLVLIF